MVSGRDGRSCQQQPWWCDGQPSRQRGGGRGVTADNPFKTFPVKKEQRQEVAAGGERGVKIEMGRDGVLVG